MAATHIAFIAISLTATAFAADPAWARTDALRPLHKFVNTGPTTPSQYANGASPYAELLQASDGNFYGTTIYGGKGLCPKIGTDGVQGCGTIFRMTAKGKLTTLYSFPFDTQTNIAPNGAYPTAGLIQGADGFLYGVTQDGGIGRCGNLGCGTLFRMSLTGTVTLLHQFCYADGCPNYNEGGSPMGHLVQLPDQTLCGTTAAGGIGYGTLFCASTGGAFSTAYVFNYANGTDGIDPVAALLVGADGQTLYGTTTYGGAHGGGTVFAYKGGAITILYAFATTQGSLSNPESALIFGANGKLYGTTYGGNPAGGIFSLNTDGSGFSAQDVFSPGIGGRGYSPTSGLMLARDGLMYGTTYAGGGGDGAIYSYNPVTRAFRQLADFGSDTGAGPHAVVIEGLDNYLYGTTTLYGGTNANGNDSGSVFRLDPALGK